MQQASRRGTTILGQVRTHVIRKANENTDETLEAAEVLLHSLMFLGRFCKNPLYSGNPVELLPCFQVRLPSKGWACPRITCTLMRHMRTGVFSFSMDNCESKSSQIKSMWPLDYTGLTYIEKKKTMHWREV